jgi:hypothetical protein
MWLPSLHSVSPTLQEALCPGKACSGSQFLWFLCSLWCCGHCLVLLPFASLLLRVAVSTPTTVSPSRHFPKFSLCMTFLRDNFHFPGFSVGLSSGSCLRQSEKSMIPLDPLAFPHGLLKIGLLAGR